VGYGDKALVARVDGARHEAFSRMALIEKVIL